MIRALCVAISLAACGRGSAPPPPPPPPPQVTLAALLEPIRATHKLPALGAAMWRDGKLVDAAVVGLRRSGDPAHPATVDDRWHLGSDTKAMTATLIGIYVDRGVLHWDDTLAKLFPGVAIDPAFAPITLDQLLQHRAGFAATPAMDVQLTLHDEDDPKIARADYTAALLATPPAGKVGSFVYSNSSFIVAGAALERAAGMSWEDLMRMQLFAPLDMRSCGFGPPGTTAAVDQPWGHQDDNTPIAPDAKHADNPPGLGPAGTVHCSLADWGKFLVVHAGGAQTLISPAALAHLHTRPAGGDYMGGWGILPDGRLSHAGSNTHWFCEATLDPKAHTVLAWVTNHGAGGAPLPIARADVSRLAEYAKAHPP